MLYEGDGMTAVRTGDQGRPGVEQRQKKTKRCAGGVLTNWTLRVQWAPPALYRLRDEPQENAGNPVNKV